MSGLWRVSSTQSLVVVPSSLVSCTNAYSRPCFSAMASSTGFRSRKRFETWKAITPVGHHVPQVRADRLAA